MKKVKDIYILTKYNGNSKIEESGLGGKKRTDRLYWVVNIC